jgi:hypothetical protein
MVEIQFILQQRTYGKILQFCRSWYFCIDVGKDGTLDQVLDDECRIAESCFQRWTVVEIGRPQSSTLNIRDLPLRSRACRASFRNVRNACEPQSGFELDDEGGLDVFSTIEPASVDCQLGFLLLLWVFA